MKIRNGFVSNSSSSSFVVSIPKDFVVTKDMVTEQAMIELWENDWYDGPLSGIIEVKGKEYWVEAFDESDWVEWEGPNSEDTIKIIARLFVILNITQEQYDYEYYWHDLWTLCDKASDKDAARKFYRARQDEEREDIDLTNHDIVGWFAE